MKRPSKRQGANSTMMLVDNPAETSDSSDAPGRHWYDCKICGKKFKTFQALGGHQGNHKKVRKIDDGDADLLSLGVDDRMLHQCKMCRKKFETGQALGGHMRKHKLEKDLIWMDRKRRLAAEEKLESGSVVAVEEVRRQKVEEDERRKVKSELVLAAKELRLAIN